MNIACTKLALLHTLTWDRNLGGATPGGALLSWWGKAQLRIGAGKNMTLFSDVHNNITRIYTSDISRQRTVYIYIQFVQRHAIHILRIKCNLKLWEQKCVNITGMSYFEKRWPIMQEKLSILRWYFNVFGPSDVLFLRERKKTVRSLRVDSNTRSLH